MSKGWRWGGQFAINLEPRWTTSYHAKEGFQVSRGNKRGSKGESARGAKKQGDCAYILSTDIRVCIYNKCIA
jgi:hypothetical protein